MGSSPTPRTFLESTAFSEFTDWLLEVKRNVPNTIKCKIKIIKRLSRQVNFWDSKAVEKYIVRAEWSNGYKNNVFNAYADWCRYKGFDYTPKLYRRENKLPYIPRENEIDQLISGCGRKLSCFLQILKESAFRPIEAIRLAPEDFDLNQQICYMNKPAKSSNPRMFKMSNKLVSMITPYLQNKPSTKRIWAGKLDHLRRNYSLKRRAISQKIANTNLIKISFRTFRHWKATMEYHKTKDILHVMRLLGHKRIQNTLVYTHLVNFESDDWVCKVASSLEEAVNLIEAGFEYVTEFEGKKIFRKRK